MVPQDMRRQYLVYLAHAISGLNFEKAFGWYEEVEKAFPRHMIALKPLRGAEWERQRLAFAGKYYDDPHLTPKEIALRCYHDVDRADALLVNLLEAKVVSRGSCAEVARAAWRKPIVVIMQEGNPHWGDPMLEAPSIVVPTLGEGIRKIVGMVSPI